MIILPRKGLGFISVTKCASTTIEAGLSNQKGLFIAGTPGLKHTNYKLFEAHILPFLEAKKIGRPHFFAITREPADRLLSWYKFLQRDAIANATQGSKKQSKYTGDMTFEEFAEGAIAARPEKQYKIQTQRSFLVGQSKNVEVDTLIRVEKVDELLPHLFSHFRVSWPKKVERRNISPTPQNAAMTDDLRRQINESAYFAADYDIYKASANAEDELAATLKPRRRRRPAS